MRRNLEAMGMASGQLGNVSGYVAVDFAPLSTEGRAYHDSVALQAKANPAVVALWSTMLARLGE